MTDGVDDDIDTCMQVTMHLGCIVTCMHVCSQLWQTATSSVHGAQGGGATITTEASAR